MKRMITTLVMVSVLSLVSATSAIAEEPLTGTMDLEFNLGWTPLGSDPVWVGTITIDENDFGMAFFVTGSGKSFALDPPFDADKKRTVHFFAETWVIYDAITPVWDEGVLVTLGPGNILLSGNDRGITNLANSKYQMNGSVEVANGDFSMLEGRNVHMSGDVVWYPFGAPHFAPGTFRIN